MPTIAKNKKKKSKITNINENVNKKMYIDALINNSNFQNIDLLPPHCKSHESDDQIFAFAVLPHIYIHIIHAYQYISRWTRARYGNAQTNIIN